MNLFKVAIYLFLFIGAVVCGILFPDFGILAAALIITFGPLGWYLKRVDLARTQRMSRKLSVLVLISCLLNAVSIIAANCHEVGKGTGKAKESEARTNLGAIFTTQVAYFANYNTYGTDFTMLNWAPAGGSRYTYYVQDMSITNTKGTEVPYRLDGNWPFTIRPASSATGFTAIAIGNIDGDLHPDVWMINDAKQIVRLFDDRANRDLTHFFISPPTFPMRQRLIALGDRAWYVFEKNYYWLILANLLFLAIFIIRSEVRWGRAG